MRRGFDPLGAAGTGNVASAAGGRWELRPGGGRWEVRPEAGGTLFRPPVFAFAF
jgi:hypothetical protein